LTIDIFKKLYYNIIVPREREKIKFQKNLKKSKKPLDKPFKKCYNEYRKTENGGSGSLKNLSRNSKKCLTKSKRCATIRM